MGWPGGGPGVGVGQRESNEDKIYKKLPIFIFILLILYFYTVCLFTLSSKYGIISLLDRERDFSKKRYLR
jgi:hypothetical protein